MSLKRLILLFIIAVYTANLHAEEQLKPITVTASRTAASTKEVGSSVSVIGEQNISNRQVPFVADLLRDVPGTAISQNGGAGTFTQLRLRGAEANHALVLIDGIEANDAAIGAEFDFGSLLTCGLERIEVLRGPQSSLWGGDALAGVVNIQTKKGDGPLHIKSTFSSGRFDTRQNCTGISGGNEQHNFSAFGAYFENNGTNISEQGSEEDGNRNTTLNFRYGLTALDNIQFELSGRHVDATVETDPFDPPTDADRETETIQNYLRLNSIIDTFGGVWMHKLGVAVTDTDNEFFADRIETNSNKAEKIKFDYQSNIFISTPELANTDHVITFVFERERERFEQAGEVFPDIFGGGLAFDPNQNQKIYNTGFVGEYRLGFSEQLFLTASLRHDDNDEFRDSTTRRFSASYAPDSLSTRFHAAYGTAVKNPTFVELFGFFPGRFIGNPDLKPEKSKGWEAGVSHAFSDHFDVGVTYFSEELEDEISGFLTSVNLNGESDRKGIELFINAQVIEGLDVQGAYTYVDSREPDFSGKTSEIRVPNNTASLVGNYRFYNDKANINLRVSYTGKQFDTNFATFERVELDDYTLVSFAGEYQLNNWFILEGRVENLFDKDYQDIFGYETQGINAHIGIKLLSNL